MTRLWITGSASNLLDHYFTAERTKIYIMAPNQRGDALQRLVLWRRGVPVWIDRGDAGI